MDHNIFVSHFTVTFLLNGFPIVSIGLLIITCDWHISRLTFPLIWLKTCGWSKCKCVLIECRGSEYATWDVWTQSPDLRAFSILFQIPRHSIARVWNNLLDTVGVSFETWMLFTWHDVCVSHPKGYFAFDLRHPDGRTETEQQEACFIYFLFLWRHCSNHKKSLLHSLRCYFDMYTVFRFSMPNSSPT